MTRTRTQYTKTGRLKMGTSIQIEVQTGYAGEEPTYEWETVKVVGKGQDTRAAVPCEFWILEHPDHGRSGFMHPDDISWRPIP